MPTHYPVRTARMPARMSCHAAVFAWMLAASPLALADEGGTAAAERGPASPAPGTRAIQANDVLIRAISLVGTPYVWGGNTPESGFDCSGLVHYVFGQVAAGSARLPRSTAQWAAVTVPVDEAALQRGDLVFFNTSGAPFSHMGIYVGGGQFVHAPSSGGTVRKDAVNSRYFGPRYLGGRRVFAG